MVKNRLKRNKITKDRGGEVNRRSDSARGATTGTAARPPSPDSHLSAPDNAYASLPVARPLWMPPITTSTSIPQDNGVIPNTALRHDDEQQPPRAIRNDNTQQAERIISEKLPNWLPKLPGSQDAPSHQHDAHSAAPQQRPPISCASLQITSESDTPRLMTRRSGILSQATTVLQDTAPAPTVTTTPSHVPPHTTATPSSQYFHVNETSDDDKFWGYDYYRNDEILTDAANV